MKKVLVYSFGAIALYLVVYNYTGAGHVINEATKGGTSVIKAFQGR
jgi:hypothetical protein